MGTLRPLGVDQRPGFAEGGDGLEPRAAHALAGKIGDHRVGAALAQALVVGIRPHEIGVPVDAEADLRELLDPVGLPPQDFLRFGVEHGGVELEVHRVLDIGGELLGQRHHVAQLAGLDQHVVHGRVAEGAAVEAGPGFPGHVTARESDERSRDQCKSDQVAHRLTPSHSRRSR